MMLVYLQLHDRGSWITPLTHTLQRMIGEDTPELRERVDNSPKRARLVRLDTDEVVHTNYVGVWGGRPITSHEVGASASA